MGNPGATLASRQVLSPRDARQTFQQIPQPSSAGRQRGLEEVGRPLCTGGAQGRAQASRRKPGGTECQARAPGPLRHLCRTSVLWQVNFSGCREAVVASSFTSAAPGRALRSGVKCREASAGGCTLAGMWRREQRLWDMLDQLRLLPQRCLHTLSLMGATVLGPGKPALCVPNTFDA